MTGGAGLGTVADLLEERAGEAPHALLYTYLLDGEMQERHYSRSELLRRARGVAARLREVCRPGDRALLLFPPDPEFIIGLYGCLLAEVVAVPAYPPDPSRLERSLPRLRSIARDAGVSVVLTVGAVRAAAPSLLGESSELGRLPWVETGGAVADEPVPRGAWREDDVAIIQYTSGSTGDPKGVMLSHRNLFSNLERLMDAFQGDESMVEVLWLPFYHDLGLIGGLMGPLYSGGRSVLFSPIDFLRKPVRWLHAIDRHRGTISGAPNFAYELCIRKTRPEERADLDLSCWRFACIAAEPVRWETIERFCDAFSVSGFDRNTFSPCYGLAEATLIATGRHPPDPPGALDLDPAALERGRAVPVRGGGGRTVVSCGAPFRGDRVRIVDPDTGRALGDGEVGEIWFSGEGVAEGYWSRPELSREAFEASLAGEGGRLLRTGDLGFTRHGELYVTGRLKDLLIVRGRNLYPQDVEVSAESAHAAVRSGCTAAFSLETGSGEHFGLVAEVDRRQPVDLGEVESAVVRRILADHEVAPHRVVLVAAGSIPKTSSGKIQRFACRQEHLAGRLQPLDATGSGADAEPGTPARDDVRDALREVVAEELGVEPAGIDPERPLADLGVDSLVATVLAGEVEARFGVCLEAGDLGRQPSLSVLAGQVASRARRAPAPDPAEPPAREGPLSVGQQGLWTLRESARGTSAYDLGRVLRIRGPLSTNVLRRALDGVIRRHPGLRTEIRNVGGEPRQVVHTRVPSGLRVHDARGWSQARTQEAATELARTPLALDEPPTLRMDLLARSDVEHLAVVRANHLCIDLWSAGRLLAELEARYERERAVGDAESGPPEVGPIEHARAQERLLGGEDGARLVRFWREELKGFPASIELPWDHRTGDSERGAAAAFDLSEEATSQVERVAREHGCSVATVLLAAFQALLARWTGQERFVVGVLSAGRSDPAWRRLVGFLANVLPVPCDVTADPSFAWHLDGAARRLAGALAHQELPFPRIVKAASTPRSPHRAPLVQVAFSFENPSAVRREAWAPLLFEREAEPAPWADLELEALPVAEPRVPFELTFRAARHRGGIHGVLEYRLELFAPEAIEALRDALVRLLESSLAHPELPLSRLPLLSEEERRRAVVAWNATRRPYPEAETLEALFARQAARRPGAVAIDEADRRLTYGELAGLAGRLAARLRERGVRPGDHVGVLAEPGIELVAGVLAVLYAGAAYVPVDPADESSRGEALLRQAGVRTAVIAPAFAGRLGPELEEVVAETGRPPESPAPTSTAGGRAGDPACVMHTSGSTGVPKGVLVPHRAISRLVLGTDYIEIRPDDRIALAANPAFDASTFELWGALLNGAGLVVLPHEVLLAPRRLAGWIRSRGITVLFLTTSLFEWLARESPAMFRPLRCLIFGGESVSPDVVRQILERGAPGHLLHVYGPTEATTFTTAEAVEHVRPGTTRIPLGRPIANSRAYVLDRHLVPLPPGFLGELCIGGDGVARGYLGDRGSEGPFVPDPFDGSDGALLYRSGDRARWLPDGRIEFRGRADQQIKIRGFRVEPGEVEAIANAHPGVAESAAVPDATGRILLHWTPAAEEPAEAELRKLLEERLPFYMQPAACVRWARLPRTAGGKIDRTALSARGRPGRRGKGREDSPSELESQIAGLWSEVLDCGEVGLDEDFFELGGDSLAAAQVAAWLSERTGAEVDPRFLLRHRTVATVAAQLASRGPAPPRSAEPDAAASSRPLRPGPFVTLEERPLLDLFAAGQLEPVDAASLATLPGTLAAALGPRAQEMADRFLQGVPRVVGIESLEGGRIALIALPCFHPQVYVERERLLGWVRAGIRLAGTLGARVVTLTGLLAASTAYGRELGAGPAPGSPRISTGHATTAAAVVLTLEGILGAAGRSLDEERLGVLGVGSVGESALRLLLRVLPHPREILLCDLYSEVGRLEALAGSLRQESGYAGGIRVLSSRGEVPDELLEARVLVAATNAPGVLAVEKLRPGTLLVDDSGPPCFDPAEAIARFESEGDILVTEAGFLHLAEPVGRLRYVPPGSERLLAPLAPTFYAPRDPRRITGCILSALLSAQDPELVPTLGRAPDPETCHRHWHALRTRRASPAGLELEGWIPAADAVARFRERFGGGA